MYTARPDDINVTRTTERIEQLERHSRRLAGDRHPFARLDRAYCLREIHNLSADLARVQKVGR